VAVLLPLWVTVEPTGAVTPAWLPGVTAGHSWRQDDEQVEWSRPSVVSMYTVRPDPSTSTLPKDVLATWSPAPPPVLAAGVVSVAELVPPPPHALRVRAAAAPRARAAGIFFFMGKPPLVS
jgi:hypothetical protein